ncbi:MAG: zf-HC2 domain-containing protein [Eubacteriales bacterium]
MTCKESYALLFMYAKGTISPEDKKNIEEHISGCKQCGDIARSLKELCPKLALGHDDETSHFIIGFNLNNGEYLSYLGFSCHFDNAKHLNEILEKTGGIIPEGENWFGFGHDSDYEHIGEFDNEGNKIEFICYPSDAYPNNTRVQYKKMKMIFFPEHWSYSTLICKKTFVFTKSTEAPNLFYGHMQNSMGNNAHSALYLAIPGAAHNVRIKRGNGVHDCGTYKFAYVSRYVTEEERIVLECSFLLD